MKFQITIKNWSAFGLNPRDQETITSILSAWTEQLSTPCKVWLFGSRATATFQQYSDIDLLIQPDHPDQVITKSLLTEAFKTVRFPTKSI